MSHEPRIQQLSDDLEKLGLHPFHLPIGVNLAEVEPGRAARSSVCIRCDRVDGFPCVLNGEVGRTGHLCGSGAVQDNVTLVTGANVQRLETDASGRSVTGVVTLLDDGSTTTFTGDIVVVACGAVNSAALLLKSRGDRHPDGLANSSGVVGRHYMRHNNVALMAVSKEPNPTRFQKTLAMNDWYLGSDDFDFPLGGIQMLGKSDEEEIRAQAPRWAGKVSPDLPFEVLAHHAVDFWLCGEDLPLPDNRVTVDAEGAIHLSIDEKNNVEGVKRLRHKLDGMLSQLGMERAPSARPQPVPAQEHADRRDSAPGRHRPLRHRSRRERLDVNCKAHDVDNLYVVDTSFFPSIGAVNPSLTAIANALRVGDHITERLALRPGPTPSRVSPLSTKVVRHDLSLTCWSRLGK